MTEFSEFAEIVPEMNVVEQLAGRVHDRDAPLTAEQSRRLVQVLQQNRHSGAASASPANTLNGLFVSSAVIGAARGLSNLVEGSLIMPGHLAWSAPVTDAAIAHARAILTDGQLAALRELQAQQVVSYQLAPSSPKGATPEQALEVYGKSGRR